MGIKKQKIKTKNRRRDFRLVNKEKVRKSKVLSLRGGARDEVKRRY